MAITFKAVVVPGNRRQDGTYNVKIRVTSGGQYRRIPTNIYAAPSDLTRGLRIKSPDILNKTDAIIADMRRAVGAISPFDLEGRDIDWVVGRIRRELAAPESFHLDFFEFAEGFLKSKKPQTAGIYYTALAALERFLGKRELDVNDVTKRLLEKFSDHLAKEPKMVRQRNGSYKPSKSAKDPGRASARYISYLAHIYAAARTKYNDEDTGEIRIPRSPFAAVRTAAPVPVHGQRNLGRELVQEIISYRTDDPAMRMALDLFVVSFALMGANLVDLWNAAPFRGRTWVYNRAKTADRRPDHAEMRVDVPKELAPYLGRLASGEGGWWLAAIHARYSTRANCNSLVNRLLTKWCKERDVRPFTLYAARHSWATIARQAGIEKATVDECLAHVGDFAIADIYAERSWANINAANAKVLSLFSWE